MQIPIRRISLFDIRKNEEELAAIARDMEQTIYHQGHIVEFTVAYIRRLLEKYGPEFPRKTEITSFSTVNVREIARRDVKVFHDRVNYYLGTNVKSSSKDGAPIVCTEFDRLVLLRNDGSCRVISVPEKEYIGPTKYVLLADKEQIYSILYRDRLEGTWFAKRFRIGQFMLGKEYHILPKNCLIENLYTNAGVVLSLELAANHRRSYHSVTVDFDSLQLRSRDARGFKLTHYPITDIKIIKRGTATPTDEQKVNPDPDDDAPGDDGDNGPNGSPPPAPPPPTPTPAAPATPAAPGRHDKAPSGPKSAAGPKPAGNTAKPTPTASKTIHSTPDHPKTEDGKDAAAPPAKPGPKSSLKLLIDEKTPFFLEDE
jgi:topoisomerase-4 subunit A